MVKKCQGSWRDSTGVKAFSVHTFGLSSTPRTTRMVSRAPLRWPLSTSLTPNKWQSTYPVVSCHQESLRECMSEFSVQVRGFLPTWIKSRVDGKRVCAPRSWSVFRDQWDLLPTYPLLLFQWWELYTLGSGVHLATHSSYSAHRESHTSVEVRVCACTHTHTYMHTYILCALLTWVSHLTVVLTSYWVSVCRGAMLGACPGDHRSYLISVVAWGQTLCLIACKTSALPMELPSAP